MSQLKQHKWIFLFSFLAAPLAIASDGLTLVQKPSGRVSQNSTMTEKLSKKILLNYLGIYRGASLQNLSSPSQPTVSGEEDPSNPQVLDSFLTVGYKLEEDWALGMTGHFKYALAQDPLSSSQNLSLLDPVLMVQKNHLVSQGGFNLNGKLTLELPVSSEDSLQHYHLATAVTPTIMASYTVPETSLTLGAFTFLRAYVPGSDVSDAAMTYRIFMAPHLNYQITPTFAATLWVDLLTATRYRGRPFFTGMEAETMDIQPGFNWDITRSISLNPVLNIYPAHPTLSSTSIEAYLSIRAL
ncbi:MAG: transporter [Bdellovibrionia bacterium]